MHALLSGSGGRPLFLASVMTAEEAAIALGAGADIIDAKDPTSGALGALDRHVVRAIVEKVGARKPVSATVGDLPSTAAAIVPAIEATAETGVDIVKIGIFGGAEAKLAIAASALAKRGKAVLVGVLMADREPDFDLIAAMADAGYAGVMLDTADKSAGALTSVMPAARCAGFISAVHRHRMFAGLAGSIKAQHLPALAGLKPDILGFRGALCRNGLRAAHLDGFSVAAVAHAIDKAFPVAASDTKRRVGAGARA